MSRKTNILLVTCALAALPLLGRAEVKPNGLFSAGAVLQQGKPLPVWGSAKDGEKVTVSIQGQSASTIAANGRWLIKLQPLKAGGPFKMTIEGENKIELDGMQVGEVWLCSGQSNMGFTLARAENAADAIAQAKDPHMKLFTVPRTASDTPLDDISGQWQETTPATVSNFSAVAYFFGRDLRQHLKVPVGLIWSAVGGTPAEAWTPRETLEMDPVLNELLKKYDLAVQTFNSPTATAAREQEKQRWDAEVTKARAEGKKTPAALARNESPSSNTQRPCGLYNAMIAPLHPYALAGVIWYQGENNAERAAEYKQLLPAMIASWRTHWGQGNFPFLFVQIAPHGRMSPEIREAQLWSWQHTPNTAMIVTTDVGDAKDIHPRKKEPVGARLALAARAVAYGEKIEYSGPIFDSMTVQADQAILSFKHVDGGLTAKGGELRGFTLAGENGPFTAAKAEIDGDKVIVSSDAVQIPKAVRYGWSNTPEVNLFNQAGLPASPFRTDTDSK